MTKLNLASLKKQNLSSTPATPKIEPISLVPESTRPKVSLTQFRREREVKEEVMSVPELVNPLVVESSNLELPSLSAAESSLTWETPILPEVSSPSLLLETTPEEVPEESLPTREFFPNLAVADDTMFSDLNTPSPVEWTVILVEGISERIPGESPISAILVAETVEVVPALVGVSAESGKVVPESTWLISEVGEIVPETEKEAYVQDVATTLSGERVGGLSILFSKEKRILVGSLIGVTTLCITGVVLFATGVFTPGKASIVESTPLTPAPIVAVVVSTGSTVEPLTSTGESVSGSTQTGVTTSLTGSTQSGATLSGTTLSGVLTSLTGSTQSGVILPSIPPTGTGSTQTGIVTLTSTGTFTGTLSSSTGSILTLSGTTLSGGVVSPGGIPTSTWSIVPSSSSGTTNVIRFRTPNIPKKR